MLNSELFESCSMKNSDLYTALGELFYGVSCADGKIDEKEQDRLRKELDQVWKDWDNKVDEFGSDSAHYITFAFDALREQDMESDEAWQRFKTFYQRNKMQFDPDLKAQIIRTATAIAYAKAGFNKAELGILSDLHLLFN